MTFRFPAGLPGSGPWRILDDCPSMFHNTLHSALGRHAGGQKCTCPRALHLKATRRQNGQKLKAKPPSDPLWNYSRFLYMAPAVVKEPMPAEMGQAACRDGEGLAYADDGMDRHMTKAGVQKREGAKAWCHLACPVIEVCAGYAKRNEFPAGSWGGVWGGLDPWERRGLKLVVIEGKVKVKTYEPTSKT